MAVNRDPILKRCRSLQIDPSHMGIFKESKRTSQRNTRKMSDYGPSWRILRPESLTDQIFIKAKRIRTLETVEQAMVAEDISGEWVAIVNYGIMGIIQLGLPSTTVVDIDNTKALALYDSTVGVIRSLLSAKNHDYGEAWRDMRPSSYTDMVLTKIQRTKCIENNNGKTVASEGIDANYMDMVNYAVFALIKLTLENS